MFHTLDPLKKCLNLIFGPVGFGLLTLANVRNFQEASRHLDQLKEKQNERDRLKREINEMANEFQQLLLTI